jgi:hypothetical protein
VQLIGGAVITGGTLTTTGTGIITTPSGGAVQDAATLSGVTLSTGSHFVGAPNSQTTLVGTITNNGTMELASTGPAADFFVSGDVTLIGTGTMTLSNNNLGNRIRGGAGSRLINDIGHTIQGAGQVGLGGIGLTNQGLMLATGSAGLAVDTNSTIINSGILQANTGGLLTLSDLVNNSGTIYANGGTVTANAGFAGSTGTARIDPGGVLNIGAASTVGTLTHNGTTASSLNLGANGIIVYADYNNANFGTGNGFNARANVSGTGQILAAGTPAQAQLITGAGVTNGGTAAPTLTIGNVHVGTTTINYQIANSSVRLLIEQ